VRSLSLKKAQERPKEGQRVQSIRTILDRMKGAFSFRQGGEKKNGPMSERKTRWWATGAAGALRKKG